MFTLEKSFGIDNGELNGQSPQECFVLGYELATIDYKIQNKIEIKDQFVHSMNRERIIESCKNLDYSLTWPPHDISESWMVLTINR